jgi:hypothetical protein
MVKTFSQFPTKLNRTKDKKESDKKQEPTKTVVDVFKPQDSNREEKANFENKSLAKRQIVDEDKNIRPQKRAKIENNNINTEISAHQTKPVLLEDDDGDVITKDTNSKKIDEHQDDTKQQNKKETKLDKNKEGDSTNNARRKIGARSSRFNADYRKCLSKAYNGACAVTGQKLAELHVAQSVLAWKDIGTDIPLATTGILLRVDLAYMFKERLWTLDEEYCIKAGNKMMKDEYYAKFNGQKLILPNDEKYWLNQNLLKQHRQEFIEKEANQ